MKLTIVLLVAFAILACGTGSSAAKNLVDKLVHSPVLGDLLKGIAEQLVAIDHTTSAPDAHTDTDSPTK
uniref:Uncharacterized protein n=1 Tax=Anopheles minimus TaxID=112268 RepID=A0A182VUS4_9DIPT